MKDLKQKTFKAYFWDMIGKFADQGLGFFISIILARLLAPEEFGLLAMAIVIISFAHVIVDAGLGVALVQRKTNTDTHYGSVFFFNVFVGILLNIVFYFSAPWIAIFYKEPEIELIVKALSFLFIINAFGRVKQSWLTRNLYFDVITKGRIFALILSGAMGIVMAFGGYGVWALVFQQIINSLAFNLFIVFRTKWNTSFKFSFSSLKELWNFGFWMFLSALIYNISTQVDRLVIGKLFNADTLGYYQRARSFDQFVIKYSSASIMQVFLPALSSVQDDLERFRGIANKVLHVVSFATLLLVGFLYVTAEDIIVVLFSEKWLPSVPYFKLLMLSAYGVPLSKVFENILSSKGNSKVVFKVESAKQILLVLTFIIGFINNSLHEFLYGYAVYTIFALLMYIYYSSIEIQISSWWYIKKLIPYFILSTVLIVTITIIDQKFFLINNRFTHGLITGSVFLFFYFSICYFFKIPGLTYLVEELKPIFSKILRKRRG